MQSAWRITENAKRTLKLHASELLNCFEEEYSEELAKRLQEREQAVKDYNRACDSKYRQSKQDDILQRRIQRYIERQTTLHRKKLEEREKKLQARLYDVQKQLEEFRPERQEVQSVSAEEERRAQEERNAKLAEWLKPSEEFRVKRFTMMNRALEAINAERAGDNKEGERLRFEFIKLFIECYKETFHEKYGYFNG